MELDRGILLSQVKDGESEPCIGGLCHAGQELREASVDYNTSQDQTAYERAMQAAQLQRQQQEQAAELARAQVDAMLSAGVRPSDSLVTGSGYQGEYVQALENYYRQQNAPKASGGGRSSGGSSGSSGGGKPNLTWSQTRKEIEAGNLSPAVLAAYEYYMGEEYRQKEPGQSGTAQSSSRNTATQTGGTTNRVAPSKNGQQRIEVEGYGYVDFATLEDLVNQGKVVEKLDPKTGRYTYWRN